MPLRGVYIPHFDQISVKISVFGVLYTYRAPMGMRFGTEEGTTIDMGHWGIRPLCGEGELGHHLT